MCIFPHYYLWMALNLKTMPITGDEGLGLDPG